MFKTFKTPISQEDSKELEKKKITFERNFVDIILAKLMSKAGKTTRNGKKSF